VNIKMYCWSIRRWGESTIIVFNFLEKLFKTIHVIDFGAHDPFIVNNYVNNDPDKVLREARNIICTEGFNKTSYHKIEIIITHLHYDHYSLIPYIISSHIEADNLYVPGIPKEPSEIKEHLIYFLAVYESVLEELSREKILRSVLDKARYLTILFKDDYIDINRDLKMYVKWPPKIVSTDISDNILKTLRRCHTAVEELINKAGISRDKIDRKIRSLGKIYEKMSEKYSEELEKRKIESSELRRIMDDEEIYLIPLVYEERRLCCKKEILYKRILKMIDRALNSFSLALEYHYNDHPIIVLPGDNSDKILDHLGGYLKDDMRKIVFLRGAHHGTSYGEYINIFRPYITWLSQMSRKKYRDEYWRISRYVATARDSRKLKINIYVGKKRINISADRESKDLYFIMSVS